MKVTRKELGIALEILEKASLQSDKTSMLLKINDAHLLLWGILQRDEPPEDRISRLEKVELGPNDIVVITVQDRLSMAQAEKLSDRVRAVMKSPVLVLTAGAEMSVACRPEDSPNT